MSRFADRIARHLDHPVDAACGARPPGMIRIAAIAGGIGAGTGSVLGGALLAGAAGGLGVLVGYTIVRALRLRGSELSLAMALVLTAERLELHRLNYLTSRPAGLIRAIPYGEIRAVNARSGVFDMRVEIVTAGEPLVVDTSRRGSGRAPELLAELRRRIAA